MRNMDFTPYLNRHPKSHFVFALLALLLSIPFWYARYDAYSISEDTVLREVIVVSDVDVFRKGKVYITGEDGTRYSIGRLCAYKLAEGALDAMKPGATLTLLTHGSDVLDIVHEGEQPLRFEDAREIMRRQGTGYSYVGMFLDLTAVLLPIRWAIRLRRGKRRKRG